MHKSAWAIAPACVMIMFRALSPNSSFAAFVGPGCDEIIPIALSYDGSKVGFISNEGSIIPSNFTIYTVNSDGTDIARIAQVFSQESPVVMSADGKKVAFTSMEEGNLTQAFVSNTDGSGLLQLTQGGPPKEVIGISPDGSKVLVASNTLNGVAAALDFFTVKTDGSG